MFNIWYLTVKSLFSFFFFISHKYVRMQINEWNMIHQTSLFQMHESGIYSLYARLFIFPPVASDFRSLKGSCAINGSFVKLNVLFQFRVNHNSIDNHQISSKTDNHCCFSFVCKDFLSVLRPLLFPFSVALRHFLLYPPKVWRLNTDRVIIKGINTDSRSTHKKDVKSYFYGSLSLHKRRTDQGPGPIRSRSAAN